ncbi:MAG TPA: hypothetical protein VNB24_06595 [Acidimicrobiales bacterium]|nr:hypothetical protein [Acidimicrobiales bacterium]
MQTRRWTNQGLPQMLQIAVFLLYFGAFWAVLGNSAPLGFALDGQSFTGTGRTIDQFTRLFVVVGSAAGGYLISNERKLGYTLGVAVAALPLVAYLLIMVRFRVSPFSFDLVGVLFDVALFALLVHPQSRSYVRLWFK